MSDDIGHDGPLDDLTKRAAPIAPARHLPRLTAEELTALATLAMQQPEEHKSKRRRAESWSRHRVGYASAGALLVACALAVAAIVSLPASTPSRPTTSLPTLGSPVLKVEALSTNGYGGVAWPVAYKFSADPRLSTATGSATAYALASPTDMAAATGTIAEALGLPDTVTYLGPHNYNGGPSGGPDVTVDLESGILNWIYPTWSGNVHTDPALANPSTCCSIPVDPSAPLPTDDQATTDATRLLLAAGVNADELTVPTVSRYEAGVNVAFQVVVGGLPTDQEMQVEYGPGGTVLTTSGVIMNATPSATYSTISPAVAVGLLTNGSGSSDSSQKTMAVDINQATLTLSTYRLADGATWLLPTWKLSGSTSGPTSAARSAYSGSVLAIPAKYVQLAPAG